jgi:glycosyltransferase involved in cell wall biosynthesis
MIQCVASHEGSAPLPERLLVVGNYAPDGQRSMLRFSALIAEGMSRTGITVKTLEPKARFGTLARQPLLRKWLGYVDKFVVFPQTLRRQLSILQSQTKSLVVHVCDHSNARYVRTLCKVPHVITCHDLLAVRAALGEFRDVEVRWTGRQLQKDILRGLSLADHVVCDSLATRSDVLRLSHLPETRVTCQYLSFNHSAWTPKSVGDRLSRTTPRFLLHVGSDAWYKNRTGVIEIYRALCERIADPPHLLFVGPPPGGKLQSLLAASPLLNGRVRFLQGLEDVELADLYRSAEALLFPSLAEGFGWPVLEAQACGCPVLTSDRASLAEVAGEAAIFVPPDDPAQAAAALAALLSCGTQSRQAVIEKGLTNTKRFSSEQMIKGYLSAYQQAMAS